jgi:putative membrane protein
MRRPLPPIHKRERRMTMPAHIRWMALRATVLATVVLGTAFAWTAGALAYDTGGTASLAAAVGESAVQDTVAASAGGESATGTLRVTLDMDDDGHWDMGSGWWIVMMVMMVLFWGAIIAVVVWGIRQFTGDRRRDRSALDIAKERLARGEITKEEFDRIRDDLT